MVEVTQPYADRYSFIRAASAGQARTYEATHTLSKLAQDALDAQPRHIRSCSKILFISWQITLIRLIGDG